MNLTDRPIYQKTPKEAKTRKRLKAKSERKATEKHPLRENARGQNCTFRFTGCRRDPQYTVLAHYRRFNWAGAGQKPNDLLAAFGCDICHDKQERRDPEATDAELLRAMGETLMKQASDGIIKT